MAEQTFEAFIESERTRLKEKKKGIGVKIRDLEKEMAAVDNEMAAINAYEAAKKGKPAGTRTRHGGRRGEVLSVIKKHPDGIGRAEVLEALGVKGDRSGEQSVSNALSALKKANTIDNPDGKYVAA